VTVKVLECNMIISNLSPFLSGDVVYEIKEEAEGERKEGEEQTVQYILGPGLRREGSKVFVMTSGVLKCRNAGKEFPSFIDQ
jgi:hypothetical protein